MEKAHTGSEDADLLLDSVALNLHDFYSGLERVFQYIASHVDRHVPTGGEWHRELLNQMSLEVTGIRPAVLSNEIINRLDEYLRFRHVVRNVYTFHFDLERLDRLVKDLRPSFEQLRADLQDFSTFLKEIAGES